MGAIYESMAQPLSSKYNGLPLFNAADVLHFQIITYRPEPSFHLVDSVKLCTPDLTK